MRTVTGTEEANVGPLVLEWSAVPVLNDPLKWFLFVTVTAQIVTGQGVYASLDGLFPEGAPLIIDGIKSTIASFEVPSTVGNNHRFAGISGVRDVAELDGDNALFNNARTGNIPHVFDISSYELVIGLGLDVRSGVVVNIQDPVAADAIGAANPAVATIGETSDGGINLQLGPTTLLWSQRLDASVAPTEAPDTLEADIVTFEETVTWLVRQAVSSSSIVVDDGLRYSVAEVSEVSRGRFWQVVGTRRYRAVSL